MQIKEINIKNRVCNYYFDNLINGKKLETKNILIDNKNHTYLFIYFTRHVHCKSIKMLSLYYHELMGKSEEHKGKKYLMAEDYMPNKVLDKIKNKISIEHFDNTNILD